ncbi:thioredoxin-related transmembrane protein 4 isoform X2 [Chiloscyllium plagiosum]|uniref:thioredoxin-related transmembrane protein 4 isoform X2 n=1 Tax=Chiloscyllium plagiosum TaxID=36176 RepID=UPI001CB7F693|nr:thioredoxin-related transmembrane protein 4 isoform X2 [Chiloscyllium plagiosum]
MEGCTGAWSLSVPLLLLAGAALCQPQAGTEAALAVEQLGDTNWTLILSGEWMLQFHAPWCPACKQIQADWEDLGKSGRELGIHVGKIDVTREPGLSGRFFVTTLPTIYHAKEGVFRKYHGARMLEDFRSFIKEKKWEAVESISGWKSPSSVVMSGMAGLFRLSVWIRQIHGYLTETLGIPAWGSYVIFAVATLMAGLILGLFLVLIADCICPPKRQQKYEVTEMLEAEDEDSEELEKRELDPSEWEPHGSGAEDEDNPLDAKPSGDESAFEEDQPPSDNDTDGGLRKRIIPEDS